jgi:hypothetical protein
VRIVPTDGETEGIAQEVTVTVGNTAPVGESVTLTPELVQEATIVTATPVGSDVDDDTLTWEYTWYVAGGEVKRGADVTLTGVDFDKGDTIVVEATPSDGSQVGAPVTSDAITVAGTVPTVERASISPLEANELSELSCVGEGAADVDGDDVSFEVAWTVNGLVVDEVSTLTGETFDKGDVISCELVPTDEDGDGEPVFSDTIIIGNAAPSVTAVEILPTDPDTTTDLTAVVVSSEDPDGDALTYAYAWANRSTTGTGATFDASAFVKGNTVSVTVTPNDGTDDGKPLTVSTTIGNAAPSAPVPTFGGTSVIAVEDDLHCEIGTASVDPDSDSISYTIAWTRNGSAWTGSTSTTTLTGDTIDASDTARGQTWVCTVTASDGTDTASGTVSATISTCGDGRLTGDEEVDPAPGPFSTVSVSSLTCRYDFSAVPQLFCNGTCSWAGIGHCDKADADVFCKLRTGNPASTALSYTITTAVAKPGFSCRGYGSRIFVRNRGYTGSVQYEDGSLLASHGPGSVISSPVCTNP